jgi:membrane-associated phospholipid phosphatase
MTTPTGDTTASPQVRRAGRLVRGAVAMVLFALPVLLLGYAARQKLDPLIRFDDAVIGWSTDVTRSAGAADALIALQTVSQPFLLYVIGTGVALWAWLARKLRNRALWAFVTMMVAWPVGLLAKHLVQRARPVVDEPLSHSPGYSFPSGHAFNVAVVATVVVFLLWPVLTPPARRLATVVAVVVALVVGTDRMFLGVHFPSDVAAGWILGAGITFSSWLGFIGRTSPTSSSGPSHPV